MKPCEPCPSLMSIRHGLDPMSFDVLTDREYCSQKEAEHVYCPWEKRSCPVNARMVRTARRCHEKGKPIPYRLDPQYEL